MRKLLITTLLTIIFQFSALSQKPYFLFENVSSNHGLSQSEVNCITQDSKGFIWIGTLNGLNRFDGYDMVVYKSEPRNEKSLSSNYIQSIFEDNQGNLWVGTVHGLNKFQRHSDCFWNFQNHSDSTDSFLESSIVSIIQRKNGDILLGTSMGLSVLPINRINDDEPKFDDYFDFEINNIIEDKDGFVWLATYKGIYKITFDKSGTPVILSHFEHNALNPSGIMFNAMYAIFQDKEGNLWAGGGKGVEMLPSAMLSSKNPQFIHFSNLEYKNLDNVQSIFETSTGQIFIASRGGGLNLISKNRKEIFSYKTDVSNHISISNNSVKCLFEDKTGVLWAGTLGGGCNKVNLYQKKFYNYTININSSTNQGSSNFVRSIFEDRNNLLWIGTLDGGLFTFDEDENLYSKFPINEPNNINTSAASNKSILGKRVLSIFEENSENLWVGAKGINIINQQTRTVKHHIADFTNPLGLIGGEVFSIAKADDGSIWIGCWGALQHYQVSKDAGEPQFIRYQNNKNDTNSISDNVVRFVYNDPLNTDLWVATMNGGINRLIQNPDKSVKFIQYKYNSIDPGSISSNSTYMILRSKAGVLWVATDYGLNRLVENNNNYDCTFQRFADVEGLSGIQVKSILEDEKGNLWLGTNKGISKFNPSTKEFTNFDTYDGLLSSEFSDHSCFKNSKGRMYFGGVNGFTAFYPDSIKTNTLAPRVQFTNLFILNKVVPVGRLSDGRTILKNPISDTKEIELSYKDEMFAIEFSALHFAAPFKNRYAYKIEGVNSDWIYSDSKNRRVTFTNMKGGTYILKVIGSNNDGTWQSTPTTLTIKIQPPFWQTGPAYFAYIIILMLIVYSIIREVMSKERLRSDLILRNQEKEKVEALNQLKLQFFTNISHEFRTPLTLIISPLEYHIESKKENMISKEVMMTMYRNSKYLLNLVNELIDFRKAESDALKLSASKNKIVILIRDVICNFDEIASKKEIKLNFIANMPEQELWFDKEMMIKVFNNLIYNAIKFTPNGGEISVEVGTCDEKTQPKFPYTFKIGQGESALKNSVCIKITDTGIGISPQSLPNIFNRFYQVGSSDSIKHLGSGIGLALAKNLVLINKGVIMVSSERNVGTEFIVCLPMGDKHLCDDDKMVGDGASEISVASENPVYTYEHSPNAVTSVENVAEPASGNMEGALILIVEDNDDMRNYIKSCLQRNHRIIEANNGLIGHELAMEHIPDLVVSDIMMPEMNGVQLCKKLKKNIVTSHIPVVLLTSLSSVSDQIDGLETGADDYISKPFNQKLFEIRIENLLNLRKKLRERFGKEINTETTEFALNMRDQEFLEKAVQLIKEKMSEPELSVEQLSQDLFMSRRQLLRKLKALTDQAPNEFIRTVRLKEAVILLAENRYSVSEIAYKVGFTAPNYFSTCFLKQFGLTPTDYVSKQNSK